MLQATLWGLSLSRCSDSSLVGPLGEVMLELGAMRLRMNFKRTRGERLSEILNHLAAIDGLESVDPVLWQREIRGDRPLPERQGMLVE